MGYDMYMLDPPGGEAALAAREAFDSAVAFRSSLPVGDPGVNEAQRAVERAFEAMNAAQGYFRLNIFGMGQFRTAMVELGMVYDSGLEPVWPPRPARRIAEIARSLDDVGNPAPDHGDANAAELREARRYRERITSLLAAHPGEGTTIPVHKFGSNEGWHVTPVEIRAALAAYQAKGTDRIPILARHEIEPEGYWVTWIDYLTRATEHGGFRVH